MNDECLMLCLRSLIESCRCNRRRDNTTQRLRVTVSISTVGEQNSPATFEVHEPDEPRMDSTARRIDSSVVFLRQGPAARCRTTGCRASTGLERAVFGNGQAATCRKRTSCLLSPIHHPREPGCFRLQSNRSRRHPPAVAVRRRCSIPQPGNTSSAVSVNSTRRLFVSGSRT